MPEPNDSNQRTITVTVRDKQASDDGSIIVCRNSDYKVHFDFDEEWDNYELKTMVVRYPNNTYDEVPFMGDEVDLPVIYDQTKILIGVYAGDICTTTGAYFQCQLSVKDGLSGPALRPRVYVATELDDPVVPGVRYFLGERTSIQVNVPTNAPLGSIVEVYFSSGATPCTITTNLTNFDFTPDVNKSNKIIFTLIHKAISSIAGDDDIWTVEVRTD